MCPFLISSNRFHCFISGCTDTGESVRVHLFSLVFSAFGSRRTLVSAAVKGTQHISRCKLLLFVLLDCSNNQTVLGSP
jgi:TM2 domain-containing membrane protein YozV